MVQDNFRVSLNELKIAILKESTHRFEFKTFLMN